MKTNTEMKFKQTEIGEIPYDWEVVRLGDVCDTTSGGTPYRNISKYFSGNIPWVKSGELKDYDILDTEEKISEEGLKNSSAKILEKGTLLVAMYGATVGKTGILGIKATTNQAICAILPKNSKIVSNKFIQYFLIKNRNFLIRERYGGAQPNISQQVIKNLNIPLPPLEEQKKIAVVLSKIQEAVENQRKIIEKLEELKKSTMNKLFTNGLYGKETKQTEIGEIPEDWEVVRLGDVCEIMSGGTPSKNKKEYWDNGKVPWIKSGECEDKILYDAKEYINELGLKNSSAKILKQNTVLLAMVGATIGKTAFLTFEACTNQNIAGIYPLNNFKLESLYIFYALQSINDVFKSHKGFTIANLSFIKNLNIPLPPLEEQKKIAEILSNIDKMKEEAEKKLDYLNEFFNSALNLLITGKERLK